MCIPKLTCGKPGEWIRWGWLLGEWWAVRASGSWGCISCIHMWEVRETLCTVQDMAVREEGEISSTWRVRKCAEKSLLLPKGSWEHWGKLSFVLMQGCVKKRIEHLRVQLTLSSVKEGRKRDTVGKYRAGHWSKQISYFTIKISDFLLRDWNTVRGRFYAEIFITKRDGFENVSLDAVCRCTGRGRNKNTENYWKDIKI